MRVQALNLLAHPRQAWWDWRQHLGWGLLGMAGALLAGACLQSQREELLHAHRQRSAQVARLAAQQQQAHQAREQARVRAQQQTLWHSLQTQQARVLALHQALQREVDTGLRLARWQADGQKLLLQGRLPQADGLPGLQARLGEVLGQPWTLQGLHAGASASDLSWTLEAPWPPASAARAVP